MFKDVDTLGLCKFLVATIPNEDMEIKDIIKAELEFYGSTNYMNDELEEGVLIATAIDTKYSPKIRFLNPHTGNSQVLKINKKTFKRNPLELGDMIMVYGLTEKFKKTKIDDVRNIDNDSDDDFFNALERSMNTPEETHQNFILNADTDIQEKDFPRFDMPAKAEKENISMPMLQMGMEEDKFEPYIELETTDITENENSQNDEEQDNNFAYPFGGWVNEENYKK